MGATLDQNGKFIAGIQAGLRGLQSMTADLASEPCVHLTFLCRLCITVEESGSIRPCSSQLKPGTQFQVIQTKWVEPALQTRCRDGDVCGPGAKESSL